MADGQMNEPMPENVDSAESRPDAAEAPGEPATEAAPAEDKAPKWDGEFDPDRAAKLIANIRNDNARLKEQLAELRKQMEESKGAEQSEVQKLAERAEKAERELAELRTKSLISAKLREHGLSEDLAEFVTGGTEEEISAKVAKLAESVAPKAPVPSKPQPKLVPGNGSEAAAPDFDPEAIAAKVRSSI